MSGSVGAWAGRPQEIDGIGERGGYGGMGGFVEEDTDDD